MMLAFEVQDEGLTEDDIKCLKGECEDLQEALTNLLSNGLSVEIVREPLKPLAMGNVRTVVRVWRR